MKSISFQNSPCDRKSEPTQDHIDCKHDCTLNAGSADKTLLTNDTIKLAVERAHRLRARAMREAFAATVQRSLYLILLIFRTARNFAEQKRALKSIAGLSDHLLRDIGIERGFELSFLKREGVTVSAGKHPEHPIKANVCQFDKALRTSTRKTGGSNATARHGARYHRESA